MAYRVRVWDLPTRVFHWLLVACVAGLIGTGYTGPVLVRTARIDGPGTATMRFSYWGETGDGGYYADLPTDNSDLPATTKVGGPGCYAYQVDGSTFSTTIVFRAVAA